TRRLPPEEFPEPGLGRDSGHLFRPLMGLPDFVGSNHPSLPPPVVLEISDIPVYAATRGVGHRVFWERPSVRKAVRQGKDIEVLRSLERENRIDPGEGRVEKR